LSPHFFDRLAADFGNLGEFLFGDPHDTGLTRAAIPALSARERQTVFVPRSALRHGSECKTADAVPQRAVRATR
jgi:hypothetical protein